MLRVLAVALLVLAAGCVTAVPDADLAGLGAAGPIVSLGDVTASGATALVWEGKEIEATGAATDSTIGFTVAPDPCGGKNCERVPFTLAFPDGYWEANEGGVEVSVALPEGEWARFSLEVVDAAGTTVARGRGANYATTAVIERPASGSYEAVVVARTGASAYTGVVQVEARPKGAPVEDRLPNLVTLTPLDLAIDYYFPGWTAATAAAGMRGCDPWEVAEQGARRCLRFTNSVGNAGMGPLEVRLAFAEGLKSLASEGQFVQRVYRSDGSHEDRPVAEAQFHPTHAHVHYADLATFALHAYDVDADARGDLVKDGRKSGFCFYDMGLVALDHVGTTPPRYNSDAYCAVSPNEEWVTGLSAGWFDRYWAPLTDQYVDVTGVPDGVYELVSTANGGGTLLETTLDDNAASVVFRLKGDEVEVLGAPPLRK